MSSESRAPSQIPANKLYVNIAPIQSTIYDGTGIAAGNRVTWTGESNATVGALSTLGAAVLRDMGKTVYLPASGAGPHYSTVLRKVQLVTSTSVGGDNTTTSGYYTGYIQMGGMTYGGGVGTTTGVARLN